MIHSCLSIEQQIQELRILLNSLATLQNFQEKILFLNDLPPVIEFLNSNSSIKEILKGLNPYSEYVLKTILAINQGPIVFNGLENNENFSEAFKILLKHLIEIDKFYEQMGGIVGYHLKMLSLISDNKNTSCSTLETKTFLHPAGTHLNKKHPSVDTSIRMGIENLNKIFEMYPIGGAGDRLNLMDDLTNTPLPAALLPFQGRTLLEGLIRDLQAKEYLYFKLFNKQITIPIVLMTSFEKDNHSHMLSIFRKSNWFGRAVDNYFFCTQPSVPVLTEEGNWSLKGPLKLNLKPSGHGVIWLLAESQGIFDVLEKRGLRKCLIRQINNPLAGLDNTLLSFLGIGCNKNKSFGFVSCERLLRSSEGINVTVKTKRDKGFDYCLTNIEYTDFKMHGIDESPLKEGSKYSTFPTNTNILFADIPSVRKALKKCPVPGQLINMKSNVPFISPEGKEFSLPGGRLESTMQNIADYMGEHFSRHLTQEEQKNKLNTFLVYNTRLKTISTTKRTYTKGDSPSSTPEQAFYDLVYNHYLLLKECGIKLPKWKNLDQYLETGPSCLILFNPALGPLYQIIRQKIKNGRLHSQAELQLEIAELMIENLELKGSLLIHAKSPLGTLNENNFLQYGNEGRCILKNVKFANKGIDFSTHQQFWKNDLKRIESFKITLNEGSEFIAEGVIFEGAHSFEVPAFHQLKIVGRGKKWTEELIPIKKASWEWKYHFSKEDQILLKFVNY